MQTEPAAPRTLAQVYNNAVRRAEYRRSELTNHLLTVGAFVLVYAPLWVPVAGAVGFLLWYYRTLLAHALQQLAATVAALLPKTATKPNTTETGN